MVDVELVVDGGSIIGVVVDSIVKQLAGVDDDPVLRIGRQTSQRQL